MKPPAFDYRAPEALDEALELLGDPDSDTIVLAGGQSLMPMLNLRLVLPDQLLDINRVRGLDAIEIDQGSVRIGAMTRLATIVDDAELASAIPVLREAASFVAHPQIRNRGTIGGTLCHADPTAELPVVAVALGGRLELSSAAGHRSLEAEEFFRGVFQTAKRSDELLTAIELPRAPQLEFVFDELARRSHGDFPYVCLCAGLEVERGEVRAARLAAGGVAERPIRLHATERELEGWRLGGDLAGVLRAASEEVSPPSDIHGSADFRRGLLRTLIRRTVPRIGERLAIA
jgi:CO/xanthine dehydrogenase FAD-binding subunit